MRAVLVVPALFIAAAARSAVAQCPPAIQKLVADQKYDEARTEAEALVKKNSSDDAALHQGAGHGSTGLDL